MILPEVLGKDLMDKVIRAVFIHLDLLQDYAPLSCDVLWIEDWIKNQVAKHVHCDGTMLVQDLDIEADTFLGSKRIHVPANRIHLPCDVLGSAVRRALKNH